MGRRRAYPNPQKRRIYGLDSPQQDRHGKLQSKKRESTPQENRLVFLLYIKKMPLGKHCGARVLDTHRPVKLWIVTFQVISPRKKRPLFSMAGIVQSDIKAFAPILVQF